MEQLSRASFSWPSLERGLLCSMLTLRMEHSHASLTVYKQRPLGDVWWLVRCVGYEVCSPVSALLPPGAGNGTGQGGR